MTHISIRTIEGDEIPEVLRRLSSYAFRSSPPLEMSPERVEWLRFHTEILFVGVFEDGTPVACAGASPLTQNVRGALYPMAGVHNVTTHPAARRKGYAKAMLRNVYDALHRQGHVLSCLWPFRESFYERLGYVTFPLNRKAIFSPSPLAPLLHEDLGGQVEMKLAADGYDEYRSFLQVLRGQVHGMAVFDRPDGPNPHLNLLWVALARAGGETVGAMVYDLKGEQIAQFTMGVRRFLYRTSQGRYLLLGWIARHIDQASRVEMWLPAFEHPETWWDDLHIATESAPIAPMGRVLNVAGLGGMQVGLGRFTACVSDTVCPWNAGIWRFESVDGTLEVSRAPHADCELHVQALAALVYGTVDAGAFAARGWGNPTPHVQQVMNSMFPPRIPYLNESF